MEIPVKSLANGFELPAFGLGTWQMGGRQSQDASNDDASDVAAIKAAIDSGIRHIDTAEVYAAGHCETLVGRAVASYDRDAVFVATKAGIDSIRNGTITQAAEGSLRRLGLEYVDLYMLHNFIRTVDLAQVMAEMNALVERGLVRQIGVSNFSAGALTKAQDVSERPIVANQVHYNLKFREPESGLLEYCQQNDVLLNAWRPLQFGELLDPAVSVVADLAEKYDVTPAQVAINWLISQDNVVTIAKASNPEHLRENIAATTWTMEPEDVERLRKEFPGQEEYSNRIPLDELPL